MPKAIVWVGKHDIADDPALLWAPSDNGWLYEARITVPGQAEYHGYPVLPSEAIATAVIQRYEMWVEENAVGNLRITVDDLKRRYK
jgi:hypothetical protein